MASAPGASKDVAKPAPKRSLYKTAKGMFFLFVLFAAGGAAGGIVGTFVVWKSAIAPELRALVNLVVRERYAGTQ